MEANRVVEIIRRLRHDFGNDLQVVSGYTELNRSDKVKEYIDNTVRKMASERVIFDSLPAEAALYFYEQVLLAADLGVILTYQDFNMQNWQLLQNRVEPYNSVALLTKGVCHEEEPVVYCSLYEDEQGINMILSCQYFDENVSIRID